MLFLKLKNCLNFFKLAIPKLTIDDSQRKQFELDKVTKEKSVLEKTNNILQETVKEKDEITKKYREAITTSINDELLTKKIEEILKQLKK